MNQHVKVVTPMDKFVFLPNVLVTKHYRYSFLCQDRGIEYRDLAQREDELQKRMIKLSEENMELRFEVEQANKDIPRLKVRLVFFSSDIFLCYLLLLVCSTCLIRKTLIG